MKKSFFVLVFMLVGLLSFAQKNKSKTPALPVIISKKNLSHDVYDGWKAIAERNISTNGQYLGYVLSPQDGDGRVILQNLKIEKLDSIPRGADLKLSYDSNIAVFKIKPQSKLVKDLKRQKKKKEDLPKDSLGVFSLNTSTLTKIPRVISYKIPDKAANILAYLSEAAPAVKPSKDSSNKDKKTTPKATKKEGEETGYKLTVRNLVDNTEQNFGFVTDYEIAKNGSYLAFASTGNDSTQKAGVYLYDPAQKQIQALYIGHKKHRFKKLAFAENGEQLAFVADLDTNAKTQLRLPKLFFWKKGENQAQAIADEKNNPASDKNWLVSAEYQPKFAKDGSKLFFGTNPRPILADTTLLPDEIVNVEVWNYQDKRLQPQQKASLEQDRKKSYMAVYNPKSQKMIQLGSIEIPDVQMVNEGNADFVLAKSNTKYSNQHWDWNAREDAYTIATKDGSTKTIGIDIRGNVQISPEGKFAYWFSEPDTAWQAKELATDKQFVLTNNRYWKFADEEDDHPDYPSPYGIAGWSKGDENILIYDRYDIWKINPLAPASATRLTESRANKTTLRYIRLNPEERSIDLGKTLVLRSFNESNKHSGFVAWAADKTTVLHQGPFNVLPNVLKAEKTDDIVFQQMTFNDYPDLYASMLDFKAIRKISEANPQQKNYNWGTSEIVKWKSADGIELEGLLYKPEGFDPAKKYPMLTYFYEKNSDNLYTHYVPSPSASTINISYCVSNGYVVFVPDIVYKNGLPGPSAYNCIVPGVLALLEKGFIDRNRLAIQGQSWGGYQVAYLVTKTNLFAAAGAGAPVANMTSAYGGIRWGTGLSRQAQYEKSQSRIGGTLWQKPAEYIENSPLFYLPQVQTPMLIMANDEDDAVPFYQGIELFMGLKRLQKPAWLLTYNGEKHNLVQRKNRKDLSIRLYQFLDYYLKNAPAPVWMTEGLPMIEKGINQHYELSK